MQRQQKLLAVLFAAAVLGLSPASSLRAENVTNDKTTVTTTVVNPCNDELIQLSCRLHTVINQTNDSSGGFHVKVGQQLKCTGTGSLGNNYIVNQIMNQSANVQDPDNFEITTVAQGRVIAKGKAPNFLLKITEKLVVKNGEVKVTFQKTETKCVGNDI